MTISYVGGVASSRAGSTSTTTQSLTSLTGGSDSSPSEGDLVVVTVAVGSQGRNPSCAISSWSTIGTQLNVTPTTYDTSLQVSYKFMTSSPDTQITIPSSGNIADGQAWCVHVFRGVDPTTPLDVTPQSATGSGTNSRPDGPAITPTTEGAWIVLCGGGAASNNTTAYTAPSGYATNWRTANGADTNDGGACSGYYTGWTSGSHDPAAVGGGSVNSANSWCAWTIALRPAPLSESAEDTGALTDTASEVHGRGTVYHVTYPSALGEPTATQIKAGQNASGGAATAADNDLAPPSGGEYVFEPTSTLASGTSYKASFVWSNGSDNSNVVTTTAWSTLGVYDEEPTDSGALTDTATAVRITVEVVTDSGAGTDTATAVLTLVEAVSDSAAVTDSSTGALVISTSAADTAAATDTAVGDLGLSDSASNSGALTDTATAALVQSATVADTGEGTDAAASTLSAVDSVVETGEAADTAVVSLDQVEAVTDTLEGTDEAISLLARVEGVEDTGALTDDAVGSLGVQTFNESVEDSAEVIDSLLEELLAFGQSVRSGGGGGGGGKLWTRDLDEEVEEEMGAILKGPQLTPATIEVVAAHLDAPPENRIIERKVTPRPGYVAPLLDFEAVQTRRRKNRQRLLLLL